MAVVDEERHPVERPHIHARVVLSCKITKKKKTRKQSITESTTPSVCQTNQFVNESIDQSVCRTNQFVNVSIDQSVEIEQAIITFSQTRKTKQKTTNKQIGQSNNQPTIRSNKPRDKQNKHTKRTSPSVSFGLSHHANHATPLLAREQPNLTGLVSLAARISRKAPRWVFLCRAPCFRLFPCRAVHVFNMVIMWTTAVHVFNATLPRTTPPVSYYYGGP